MSKWKPQRSMDLAQEKGLLFGSPPSPSKLVSLYTNMPFRTPSVCTCGTKFSVEHALLCPQGGFPYIRHNEIRDLTANQLTEVCNDVCIEPELLPINSELFNGASSYTQDGARLDIAANGFWGGRFERTFFDVRVFNPHASSNGGMATHASSNGGMANEASVFYKRLSQCLATKWDQP